MYSQPDVEVGYCFQVLEAISKGVKCPKIKAARQGK